MKKITINYHYANTIGAKIIKFGTCSGLYHHVSVTLDNWTYESKISPFKGFHRHLYGCIQCDKDTLRIPDVVYNQYKSYLDFYAQTKIVKLLWWKIKVPTTRYDYLALRGFAFNVSKQKENALYCVEPVNALLEFLARYFNIEYKEWQKTNISPKDLKNRVAGYKLSLQIQEKSKR